MAMSLPEGTKISNSKIKYLLLVLLILAIGLGFYFRSLDKGKVFSNAKLELSGTFLLSPYGGEVDKIFVKPMQQVEKNISLLAFDSTPFRAALEQATINLNHVRAGRSAPTKHISLELAALIDLQEEKLAQARLQEEILKKEYDYWVAAHVQALLIKRAPNVTKEDYAKASSDEANANLTKNALMVRHEEASLERVKAEQVLNALKSTNDIRKLNISAEEFWAQQVASAKEALSYVELKAPFDGIITKVFAQRGDKTLAHQPLLKISLIENESFPVIIHTDAAQAKDVLIGNKAHFEGSNVQFDAEVIAIEEKEGHVQITLQATEIPKNIGNDTGKAVIYVN